MLYMIFQFGGKPVLIQRIVISFEAILEIKLSYNLANNLAIYLARTLEHKFTLTRMYV